MMACPSPTEQLAGGWSRFQSADPEPPVAWTLPPWPAGRPFLALVALLALASLAVEAWCPPAFGIPAAERWKPYLVADSLLLGIVLIAHGLPADAVLLALSVLFVLSGVISEQEAFQGFASPGVAAYAALFVLSEAFAEAKVLDGLVFRLLGQPRSLARALLKITVPVALASAVFNNGPLAARKGRGSLEIHERSLRSLEFWMDFGAVQASKRPKMRDFRFKMALI